MSKDFLNSLPFKFSDYLFQNSGLNGLLFIIINRFNGESDQSLGPSRKTDQRISYYTFGPVTYLKLQFT